MAITDINISEQLETSAPSIKYTGNEGPKSPEEQQQMQMAQLEQEYEQYKIQQIEIDPSKVLSFEEWYQSEYQAARQGVAHGGIMGVDGRRRYGIGSSIKKRLRKLIPNEVAQVASMAAPFVAPFNPIAGGLMSGLGGFDKHGSISKGLKSGLMTYGGGQLARGIGGGMGNLQGASLKTLPGQSGFGSYFSSPIQSGGGLGGFLDKRKLANQMSGLETVSDAQKSVGQLDSLGTVSDKIVKAGGDTKTTGGILKKIAEFGLDNKAILGILGASAAAGMYTKKHPGKDSLEDISRGEGMDIEGIRAEVIEAFKDPTGEKLKAIRIKYPFLGSKASKNLDLMAQGGRSGYDDGGPAEIGGDNVSAVLARVKELQDEGLDLGAAMAQAMKELSQGKAQGGRIGLYSGGQSTPSDYTMEDARKTSMQDKMGGITEIMKRADLNRQGDVGQMYMAEGGLMNLGGMEKDYRAEGGFVPIGGKEKADDVPARLSKNEFVFTADAVRAAGGGDIDQGAEVMEKVMKNLEQGGQISEETQGLAGAREMFGVSERLSEVV